LRAKPVPTGDSKAKSDEIDANCGHRKRA
jgi:hypothetical protein